MLCAYLNRLKTEQVLTSQQLSDLSGVPKSTIDRILRDDSVSPTIDTAAALIRALGGSLDEAMGIPSKAEIIISPDSISPDSAQNLALVRDIVTRVQVMTGSTHDLIWSLVQTKDKISLSANRFKNVTIGFSLAVNVCFFALLIYDFTHPEIGWIQHDLFTQLKQGMADAWAVCSLWFSRV